MCAFAMFFSSQKEVFFQFQNPKCKKKISGENTSALLLLKRRRRDTKRLSSFARECGNAPRVLVEDDHKDDLCRRLSKYSRSFVSFVRAFVLRKMKRASSLVGVAREKAALLVQGDDDEKKKKKKKTTTTTTSPRRKKEKEEEDPSALVSRLFDRENDRCLSNPERRSAPVSLEDEERSTRVRDAVVEGVLTRAEHFFLFQNKNEEFFVPTKQVGENGRPALSFAMVDIACAAVDFAEEVVQAFANGECKSENAWVYEVLSASCFRLSLKTRERRDRFDIDYEEDEGKEKKNSSTPISTISFDKETMAKMETVILTTLEYRVSKPTRATWAKEFLEAMKRNVEIVAFGGEGVRPMEFKRLWSKVEEYACVIVGASLRSFPSSPQFRASAIGAAAATFGIALSAFEYLLGEEEEEEEEEEEGRKEKRKERQHVAFVSDVKKLVKATAINAFDFGSWEREFETAFFAFSKQKRQYQRSKRAAPDEEEEETNVVVS